MFRLKVFNSRGQTGNENTLEKCFCLFKVWEKEIYHTGVDSCLLKLDSEPLRQGWDPFLLNRVGAGPWNRQKFHKFIWLGPWNRHISYWEETGSERREMQQIEEKLRIFNVATAALELHGQHLINIYNSLLRILYTTTFRRWIFRCDSISSIIAWVSVCH